MVNENGGLAQLVRAPALQAGGHRFESDILHKKKIFDILVQKTSRAKKYTEM